MRSKIRESARLFDRRTTRGARRTGAVSERAPAPKGLAGQLRGKVFVEGRGFERSLEIGEAAMTALERLGSSREERPHWHAFEAGPVKVTAVLEVDDPKTVIRAIKVEGAGAPPTLKGIRIGDSARHLVDVYGKARRFTAHFESPFRKSPDAVELEGALYYPELRTFFVLDEAKNVVAYGSVLADPKLPRYLRPADEVPAFPGAAIDARVTEPTMIAVEDEALAALFGGEASRCVLHCPAPPRLGRAKAPFFEVSVPKAWPVARERGRFEWKGARGEMVTIERIETDSVARLLDSEEATAGLLPRCMRRLPASFCAEVGALAGVTNVRDVPGADGLALRIYTAIFKESDRVAHVVSVSRRVSGPDSPDGEELARGVLASYRLTART